MSYTLHLPDDITDDLFNDRTIMELIYEQKTEDEAESTEYFDTDTSGFPDSGAI